MVTIRAGPVCRSARGLTHASIVKELDRLIASTSAVGTAVFAIYVADSIGYAGAISVMLSKDLIAGDMSRLDFFRYLTYFMSLLGTVLLTASCCYFLWFHQPTPDKVQEGST